MPETKPRRSAGFGALSISLLVALVPACGESGADSGTALPKSTAPGATTTPPLTTPGAAGAMSAARPGQPQLTSPPASASPANTPTAAKGTPAAGAPGASTPAANGASAIPPDVCGVLQSNGCVTCHQSQLQGGAPMPLQWRADFAGKARDGAAMSAKLMERVKDAKSPMPPVTTMRPMMSADHVAVLSKWVNAGMPGVEGRACEQADVATDPTTPTWANQPWPEGECEYTLTVGAHKTAGMPLAQDKEAFALPSQQTNYYCFYEQVPWGDKKVQALATRVHVDGEDDKQVVHHMVLSAIAPGSQPTLSGAKASGPGDHKQCDNPSGSTVGVWGPGPHTHVTFPKESGLLMPSGAGAFLELQVHYNNAKAGMNSRVSFEICATSKVQPNTAAVHWLGYDNSLASIVTEPLGPDAQPALDNLGAGVATGHCLAKERSRILWIVPHMHQRGKHMKIEVLRASGMRETILDRPFDFKEQTALFMEELWIEKGDTVQTTCTWDTAGGKIIFGHGSESEMCFAYALAYPMGGLAGQGPEKGTTGGDLNCAGVM